LRYFAKLYVISQTFMSFRNHIIYLAKRLRYLQNNTRLRNNTSL